MWDLLEQKTQSRANDAQRDRARLLLNGLFIVFPYRSHDHHSRDTTTHEGLDPPPSALNEENALQAKPHPDLTEVPSSLMALPVSSWHEANQHPNMLGFAVRSKLKRNLKSKPQKCKHKI